MCRSRLSAQNCSSRCSASYERGSTLVTSNLPFDEWTSIFGSERLTGALLDRLTHHVHILEMNGESYRLATSKKAQRKSQKSKQKTKESPSPSFKSTKKHNHNPGLQSPFLSTRPVQYPAAIWHNLPPPLTDMADRQLSARIG